MRLKMLLFVGFAFVAFSCSNDDEPTALNKQTLSLAGEQQVITAPPALLASDDAQAQEAASWINQANVMSSYLAYFEVPAGATKSEAKITASNGRTAATGDSFTYIWTDAQSGGSVAYQISEKADAYVFEIFLLIPDLADDWLKYFHAEEKKDKSSGFMKVYDIFGFYGDDPSLVWFGYTWERNGDIFTLVMTDYDENFKVELKVNEKTKAGSVEYYFDGVLTYDITWNADGSGEWAYYDAQGNVTDSGTWDV